MKSTITVRNMLVDSAPSVTYSRLTSVISTESTTVARAATAGALHALIPGRPGTTVDSTLGHLGQTFHLAAAWLNGDDDPPLWPMDRPDLSLGYLESGIDAITSALEDHADTDAAAGRWHTYGGWARRLAHESTLARIDVQGACGIDVDPVRDDIARDGIDEILHDWLSHRMSTLGITVTYPVTVLLCIDRWCWRVAALQGKIAVTGLPSFAQHAPAEAVVRAEASQLYAWLWGRRPLQDVHSTGDQLAVAQLWSLLRLATQ
jgi:hypothetical protein